MSLDTYRLTCPTHGTFTGRAGVDHAADCLGRKAFKYEQCTVDAIGYYRTVTRTWRPCDEVVKARPWRAPRAPKEIPAAFLAKLPADVTHEYVTEASERAA